MYTYRAGSAGTRYNLVETIGALRPRGRAAADRVNLVAQPFRRGAPRGPRPVRRRHARVGDHLAAAALQLRRHPDGHEPVPELGRARTARRTLRKLARGELVLDRGHETPATTVDDAWPRAVARCRPSRRGRSSLAVARDGRRLPAADAATTRPRRAFFALAVLAALAAWHSHEPEEATAMTAATAVRCAARMPNGWWGMAVFVATRGDALRDAVRHVLLPALPQRALAAARHRPRRRVLTPTLPDRRARR